MVGLRAVDVALLVIWLLLPVFVVSEERGPVYAEEDSVLVVAPIPWLIVLVLAEGLTVDKLVEYADVVAMLDGIWYTSIELISQYAFVKYVGLLPTNSTQESRLFKPAVWGQDAAWL